MPENLRDKVLLYADDSKLISIHDKENSYILTQLELNKLVEWANTWLMQLNLDKCKVMHFGKHSTDYIYTMRNVKNDSNHTLATTSSERDLGIQITSDLKWHSQCSLAASKGNRILGMLNRTFVNKDQELWKMLYTSLVRPHLEFASSVWNPQLKGDINVLEKVQNRATKMIKRLKHLTPEERNKNLNLTSLEVRRTRGDLIQMYNLLHGVNNIDWCSPPQQIANLSETGPSSATRGHSMRFSREHFSSSIRNHLASSVTLRENFFLNRIIPTWNSLPNDIIEAQSLNIFKKKLDVYYQRKLL